MLSSYSALLRNASRKFIHPGTIVAGNNNGCVCAVAAAAATGGGGGLRADVQLSNVVGGGNSFMQQQQQQRFINTSNAKHPDVLTKSKASIVAPTPADASGIVQTAVPNAERFPFTEPVRFEQRMKKLSRYTHFFRLLRY